MRMLLLFATVLGLSSCKSDSSSGDSEDSASKITAKEHAELIKQKLELEKDLGLLIAEHSSDDGAKIDAAKDQLNNALVGFRKVQSEHPALKPLATKIGQMQLRLRDAREKGDAAQVKLINEEIIKANDELVALSKEQSEIIEAQTQIDEATESLNRARRDLASEIPEAKHLLDALNTIEKRLIEVAQ